MYSEKHVRALQYPLKFEKNVKSLLVGRKIYPHFLNLKHLFIIVKYEYALMIFTLNKCIFWYKEDGWMRTIDEDRMQSSNRS